MSGIVIAGWDRFQHYKDRWPPWIKNYTELLADDDYLSLSGHRRSILHGLWLAYAMSHGRLTDDTASLSRRLSLRVTTADLEALNHAGFIHFSASTALAERSNGASPHALARGRGKAEGLTPEGSSVNEQTASASAVVKELARDDDLPLDRALPTAIAATITASLAGQRQGQ